MKTCALFRDRSGDLWIGSERHLWHRHGGQWDVIANPGATPRLSWVRTIAQQRDGTLWFGTFGAGLARRNGDGAFEFFSKSDGLSSESIRDIYEDREGRLWIATEDHGVAAAPVQTVCDRASPVSTKPQACTPTACIASSKTTPAASGSTAIKACSGSRAMPWSMPSKAAACACIRAPTPSATDSRAPKATVACKTPD